MTETIVEIFSIGFTIIMIGILLGCINTQPHHPENLDTFLNVDTTNGSHKYVLGIYDCMDFSIDMAENMSATEYDTGVVFVLAKDPYTNYSHMLVWINISDAIYYVNPMYDHVYVPHEYINKINSENYSIHEISIDDAKKTREEMRSGIWNGYTIG